MRGDGIDLTLHAQGVRRFDLSIGNHDYKRRFGAEPVPLTNVSVALSWRGLAYVLRDDAAQGLRRHPKLAAFAARAMGKGARLERSALAGCRVTPISQ